MTGQIDRGHNMADHVQMETDEGNKYNDAMLLFYRNEIARLTHERDSFARALDLTSRQADLLNKQVEAHQAQESLLQSQLEEHEPELREQILQLSAEVENLQWQLRQPHQPQPPREDEHIMGEDERRILHEQLSQAQHETQQWRGEAMGRGNRAVSLVWQSGVDEAVRREREKDATLVNTLRAEIDRLSANRA